MIAPDSDQEGHNYAKDSQRGPAYSEHERRPGGRMFTRTPSQHFVNLPQHPTLNATSIMLINPFTSHNKRYTYGKNHDAEH